MADGSASGLADEAAEEAWWAEELATWDALERKYMALLACRGRLSKARAWMLTGSRWEQEREEDGRKDP